MIPVGRICTKCYPQSHPRLAWEQESQPRDGSEAVELIQTSTWTKQEVDQKDLSKAVSSVGWVHVNRREHRWLSPARPIKTSNLTSNKVITFFFQPALPLKCLIHQLVTKMEKLHQQKIEKLGKGIDRRFISVRVRAFLVLMYSPACWPVCSSRLGLEFVSFCPRAPSRQFGEPCSMTWLLLSST